MADKPSDKVRGHHISRLPVILPPLDTSFCFFYGGPRQNGGSLHVWLFLMAGETYKANFAVSRLGNCCRWMHAESPIAYVMH